MVTRKSIPRTAVVRVSPGATAPQSYDWPTLVDDLKHYAPKG
jgi:hypothetical protein